MSKALLQSTHEFRPDGLSKARALLERLMDYVENDVPAAHIPTFVNVLHDIGDDLILPSDERGRLDFGNQSRVTRVIYHLLKRVEPKDRLPLLQGSFSHGHGIEVQRYLLATLADEITKNEPDALFNADALDALKAVWLGRVEEVSITNELLSHPHLSRILAAWRIWGNPDETRAWCERTTLADPGLLSFLASFCSYTRSNYVGDRAVRIQPRLNPTWIEPYLDTHKCAERLVPLMQSGQVPDQFREAILQFLDEWKMLQEGKDPDGHGAFDDWRIP